MTDKRRERGIQVTENIVRVAFTIIQMKTAAQHFETSIASHVSTGSDMGDMGHGRKQFNEIMRAAEIFIDDQTKEFLVKPMPSTNLPPHFYVTADKSTINHTTNQAVMICLVVDGKRAAIPVKAPRVYSANAGSGSGDEDTDEDNAVEVSGARANELAYKVYSVIKDTFHLSEGQMSSAWQGTCCDGQYQAKEFKNELNLLLQHDTTFNDVIWDPPHLIDLAIKDVFQGRVGNSKAFIGRLVSRSSIYHKIFSQGKMFAQAKVQAEVDDTKILVTSRTCSTRFATSQYQEFLKLLESLPTYVKAFRSFNYSEITEYQIAGQDFVFDMCGAVDVLNPVISLLIELQSLQLPIWKVVVWQEKLMKELERFQRFSRNSIPSSMASLTSHATDIENMVYKGTSLVPGWIVVDQTEGEDGEPVMEWMARELSDCEEDLQKLATDLLSSIKSRLAKVSGIQHKLVCMDLDQLVGCMAGERNKQSVVRIDEAKLEHFAKEEFKDFYEYVCTQNHVQKLAEHKELNLEPALAHVIHRKLKETLKMLIWDPNYIDILAECLKVIKKDGTMELLSTHFNDKNAGKAESVRDELGLLRKFQVCEATQKRGSFIFPNRYEAQFSKATFNVVICEENIIKEIYQNAELYGKLGVEMCICIDMSLAKGGTESIVESFYSSMKAQTMYGGQNNDILALRTKLEWLLPPVIQADKLVHGTAHVYLNGDKLKSYQGHKWPTIGDRRHKKPYATSKVVDRIANSETSLPFLC